MKSVFVAAVGLIGLSSVQTSAAGLCHCCGDATAASCVSACTTIKPAEGQCVAIVDFEGRAEISAGKNPLYDMSLSNLWIGTPDDRGLESFRRLMERARRGAEGDRKAALRDRRRGKIDDVTAAAFAKRYEDAMVNYFLGITAYRQARKALN